MTNFPKSNEEGTWHILVLDFPPPKQAISIAKGLSFEPITNPLSKCDLAALGNKGFRHYATLEPLLPGLRTQIVSTDEGLSTQSANTLNRPWLAIILFALRGYTRAMGIATSRQSWNSISIPESKRTRDDLPLFRGSLLDYHIKTFALPDTKETLEQNDIDWVQNHYDIAESMITDSHSFREAMISMSHWRMNKSRRSAIATLWSGIESLFGISSELTYRLSLYGSCLLVDRGPERIDRYNAIKRLYGLRSKAVHGSNMKTQDLEDALHDSAKLLIQLLITIIERGAMPKESDLIDLLLND